MQLNTIMRDNLPRAGLHEMRSYFGSSCKVRETNGRVARNDAT